MDAPPLTSAGFPVELQALLGLRGAPTEAQVKAALANLMGQDLTLLFLGDGPQGKTFQLPTGRLIVAQGDFPFPDGSTVTMRVQPPAPGGVAPRLVPLEVQPPLPPPLLAPLLQGEATPLLARLLLPDPPAALAPLAALFKALTPAPTPPTPPTVPILPAPLQASLAAVLGTELPPEPLPSLVGRWQAQAAPPSLPPELRAALALLAPPAGSPTPSAPSNPTPPAPSTASSPAPSPVPTLAPGLRMALAQALSTALPPEPLAAQVQRWLTPPTLPPALEAVVQRLPAAQQALVREALAPLPAQPTANPLSIPAVPSPLPALQHALERWSAPQRIQLGQALGLPPLPEGAPSPETLAKALITEGPRGEGAALPRGGAPAPPAAWEPPPMGLPPRTWASLPSPVQGLLREALGAGSAPPPPHSNLPPAPDEAQAQALRLVVATFPVEIQSLLSQVRPPPTPQPQPPRDWAEALVRWVRSEGANRPGILPPSPESVDTHPAVARFLATHPLEPEAKEALLGFLRNLLKPTLRESPPSDPGRPSGPSQAGPGAPPPKPSPPPGLPLEPSLLNRLAARMDQPGPPLPTHPEPWEAWVEASLRTLSDPEASPREAPFHALQGRDGTALFEVPLPWSPHRPLQVWAEVEEEPPPPGQPPVHRLLLGLHFTRMGETRVGLERRGASLGVRIWAEHPDLLAALEPTLQRELEALGLQVSLACRPLPQATPGPRTYAAGVGWRGMA